MPDVFKWGIIGTGMIANKFSKAVINTPGAELGAVASRNVEKAEEFAKKYSIPKTYGSYEQIAKDPELDAIYIAVPNPFHYENIMLCLENKKPVLCEKPFTLNAKQAKDAIDYARKNNVFLMEALWTRFLPIYKTVGEWIKNGEIGEIRVLKTDFGFYVPWPKEDRHVNPALGGGGLLDVGVYNIAFAQWVFKQEPQRITSMAHIGETGVDEQASIIFAYDKGQLAVMTCSLLADMPNDAWIYGSKGMIYLKDYWRGTTAVLKRKGQLSDETIYCPFENGFEYEIMEVMNCIGEGKTESPLRTLDETLATIEAMDQIRAQWGLVFPMER